jgi:hypothetical protein
MGYGNLTTDRGVSASGGRLGWRSCLRKGCGRRFQARRYNQRYCQAPECLGEVRRWQGAKRQQKSRSQPGARQRHAEAERQRRKQRAAEVSQPLDGGASSGSAVAAPTPPANSGAWSRSRRHPQIFCDRPGCYESLRGSPRAPASYCGDDCRAAMRQARDRERKWLRRKTKVGRFKRRLEYQAARAKHGQGRAEILAESGGIAAARPGTKPGHPPASVFFYRRDGDGILDSRTAVEVLVHDPQRTLDSRPRPPPSP